jgi:hypothetical protein
MHPIEIQNQERNIEKLVSNARAIISNQIALPLGILKIIRLNIWVLSISQIRPITVDLTLFREYMDEIGHRPLGTERLQWDKEALKEQDKIIDEITMRYKERIIDKCFEIIETYK